MAVDLEKLHSKIEAESGFIDKILAELDKVIRKIQDVVTEEKADLNV